MFSSPGLRPSSTLRLVALPPLSVKSPSASPLSPGRSRHSLTVLLAWASEITGSIRKLKACCTLARDRSKSLEKRGRTDCAISQEWKVRNNF